MSDSSDSFDKNNMTPDDCVRLVELMNDIVI